MSVSMLCVCSILAGLLLRFLAVHAAPYDSQVYCYLGVNCLIGPIPLLMLIPAWLADWRAGLALSLMLATFVSYFLLENGIRRLLCGDPFANVDAPYSYKVYVPWYVETARYLIEVFDWRNSRIIMLLIRLWRQWEASAPQPSGRHRGTSRRGRR